MLKAFVARLSAFGDLALSALRVMLGIIMLIHGYVKVTHGFAIGFFHQIGIPAAQIMGPFISLLELVGGACLIVGLFTRYLGVLYTIEFIVATWVIWVVTGHGYSGAERELLILFTSILLATNGGGQFSLDKSIRRWEP
ncbi:MAG TPA: DoxX family protein [bacterium]|nr:DoxX family protein [bacterium]